MSSDESHLLRILNGFTGAELEFLAEEELITIIPSFGEGAMPFLGYETPIGPFRPPAPVEVPLWIGVTLKKQRKVTIELPEWMTLQRLDEWREKERRSDAFEPPPIHAYIEVSRLVLHYARDDIERSGQQSKEIEARLSDIQDIRQAKIKKGLDLINTHTPYVTLNNMSSMELNTIRSFYSTALSKFQRLHAASEDTATSSSQEQSGPSGDEPMRGPTATSAAQRSGMRTNATRFGASSSSQSQSQQQPQPTAASATQPSQPGALTQQQDAGLEQARKLRKFK